MIRFKKLKIEISPQTVVEIGVPAWEVAIVRLVHARATPDGGSQDVVEEVGELLIDRPVPTANEEFVRLSNRYGRIEDDSGKKGLPYVAMVFGQTGIGQPRLQREIDAAVVEDPTDGLLGDGLAERIDSEQRQNSSMGG
jgi:hypothetical protein